MSITQKIINSFDNKNININQILDTSTKNNIVIYAAAKNFKKKIDINFIHKNNSDLSVLINCIVLKNGEITINVNNTVNNSTKGCVICQEVNGVVLDGTSSIKVLPTMKIANKQVNAAHSINIGAIDQEKIFYLMSKGVHEQTAITMLIDNMYGKADKTLLAKVLH
jgi:Fe-S cluster assembly scaffold protein SufB